MRNSFETLNHRWELINTPDTDPPVFSWSNTGVDLINVATATQPGVVKPDGETTEVNAVSGEISAIKSSVTVYTSGSGNWVAPKSGAVFAILIGGGGSGGSYSSTLRSGNGGYGGGGAYHWFNAVKGASYAYFIGGGGAGVSNSAGKSGGAIDIIPVLILVIKLASRCYIDMPHHLGYPRNRLIVRRHYGHKAMARPRNRSFG
ncbi:MAG: hypothetical protein LBU73_07195 [Helicobacteraceae bacterium]|nr:hypothetical protein [Helicobacteraceae bacterium]